MNTAFATKRLSELAIPLRIGVFDSVGAVDDAVNHLLDAGFGVDQITVVCSDKAREKHFAAFEHQKISGAHTGGAVAAGGVVGGILGGLTALTGIFATGGLGLLATGAILAAGGGVTGTFVGAMLTRGVERELADYYDQAVVHGKFLVAAEARGPGSAEQLALASRILENAGAEPAALPEAPL